MRIDLMDTVSIFAIEAVRVQKGHKGLEVLLFAVVRSCCHKKEVACSTAYHLTKLISLGFLHFVAVPVRSHFVSFVHYYEVPFAEFELGLQLL